jgi:precorrin-8X/cobalt-precorrin-8 methylmutase
VSRPRHPIEIESYRIMRSRVDTRHLPPLTRAVVERVVHTTADPTWLGDLVADEAALTAGRAALLAGAPLVVDVRMVAAGITARESVVAIDLATSTEGTTRSAAGIRAAARRYPDGAVWAIGNAPTALAELVSLAEAGVVRPVLVVGVPVGFVGSVAAKAALRTAGLPAVSCATERGGAAIAAATVNALLYADPEDADA